MLKGMILGLTHAYHEGLALCGQHTPADRLTVQPHLVDCPDCCDELPPELTEDPLMADKISCVGCGSAVEVGKADDYPNGVICLRCYWKGAPVNGN